MVLLKFYINCSGITAGLYIFDCFQWIKINWTNQNDLKYQVCVDSV